MLKTALKPLFLTLGLLCLGLGFLGAFLPLLPTTPFLLLAAFFLSRSSPTLHRWLLQNRLFGPVLQRWQNGGRISRPTKWTATCMLAGVLAYHFTVGSLPLWGQGILGGVVLSVLAFIWSRPEETGSKSAG